MLFFHPYRRNQGGITVDPEVPPVDNTVPTAPVLSSNNLTTNSVQLNWVASTDNVGVTGYNVYKNGILLVGLGNILSYTATGLTSGVAVSFVVKALDAANNLSVNSNTVTVTPTSVVSLALTKSLADQYYFAQDGKTDAAGTTQAVDGDNVASITAKSSGLGGNRAIYYDTSIPQFNQNIPTRHLSGYPRLVNKDGGFIHLANGLNIQYRFVTSYGGTPAIGEFMYVCRLHSGKRYEAIMSGDRGPELKRLNTGVMQFNLNDYSSPVQTFNYEPVEYETIIFHIIYNRTIGQVIIRVTDSIGDYRLLATLTCPTNSTFTNFGAGTPSHPASHDFFGYIFKYGASFSTSDKDSIIANLKENFPIGQLPLRSYSKPTMSYNSGTGNFVVTPNYQLRGGATSIDLNNTIIRWYKLNHNPGPALDNISLVATTNGNNPTLNRAANNVHFPLVSDKNEIVAAITVIDNLGQGLGVECATDPMNTYS